MELIRDILQKILLSKSLLAQIVKICILGKKGRSEVEFVRNIDGDILPIEVKSGNVTHAKEFAKIC